jgi:multicomponent Na+:H+ antiporter subunit D
VISHHLPALQVVLPLLAAPLCALWRRGTFAWVLATTVCWLTFLIAVLLLQQVLTTGPLSYAMGGWSAPWGIEYRVDILNAFMLLIVTGSGAVVISSARLSVARRLRLPPDKHAWFYTAWLLCLTGLLGITITGDAFNLFVFLEISSLSSYTLISSGRDRRALTAAYQYLIMGTIGATFILLGIGYLYVMTGTLNMVDLAGRLPAVVHTRTVQVAFAFLTVGLGLKLALFPLHLWLPNAYAYGPSVVTAFLAATATKVSVYALLRFFFTVFGTTFAFQTMRLAWVLLPLALLGIVSASLTAIFQNDVRRMLAYSSIAQISYMLLGISLVSVTGLTAAIVHLFNHALMKGTLFLALAGVSFRVGGARLENMAGLGKAMPWTMAAFVIGGLSLIGVPLTAGFISKWYLLLGMLQGGWWPVTVLVLLTSLLALIYIGRVVETAYFRPLPDGQATPQEAPLSLLLPTWVLALANLYFGIDTSLSVGVARRAAESLLGGGS